MVLFISLSTNKKTGTKRASGQGKPDAFLVKCAVFSEFDIGSTCSCRHTSVCVARSYPALASSVPSGKHPNITSKYDTIAS